MFLRSAESRQRKLMLIIDALGDRSKPVVSLEVGSLNVSVSPVLTTHQGKSPATLADARRNRKEYFVHPVIAHSIGKEPTFLGIQIAGHDVNGTSHRRSRHLARTQTALRLYATGHIAKSRPVGPVHAAMLHFVHGHTVHHHGNVTIVKTTHIDFGVSKTTALLIGMHTWSGLQQLRKLLRPQFFFDENRIYRRQSYRRFTSHCHR